MLHYKIYQLKDNKNTYLFMHYDFASTHGLNIKDYELVYEGDIDPECRSYLGVLEEIFEIFNIRRPVDFRGHSLSVSDVVWLDGKYNYCDFAGWESLPTDKFVSED